MKRELNLPLDRFKYSDGFLERIENIDSFKFLTPVGKILFCIENNFSLWQAMIKCNVSYGACFSFMRVYEKIFNERNVQLQSEEEFKYEFDSLTGICLKYKLIDGEKIYID